MAEKTNMQISDAKTLVVVLVVVGIVGAVGLLVLSTLQTTGSFTGAAAGAIGNITLAIANFFSLMPTLGIIFGAVVILGAVALIGYTAYKNM
jgi:FtsH-binding integral membrane protein